MTTGVVLRADARACDVLVDGEVRRVTLRGKLFEDLSRVKNPVTVGDEVRIGEEGGDPGIEEVLPRRNYLPRVASSHDPRAQVLFANVDQLLVVASVVQPRFSSSRTDRILAACTAQEIPAGIVLNKIDLDEDGEREEIQRTYARAGYELIATSAVEGTGLEALREILRGRTSVLYGASGAGKSTLLNALQPGLGLRTGKISRYWEAGKHTTAFSQMFRIEDLRAWVVDTPGIRAFRLWGVEREELRFHFPEFERWQAECRFPDCTHDHEPGCAVFPAVERGDIPPSRFQSYLDVLDELAPPPEDDTPVPPPDR